MGKVIIVAALVSVAAVGCIGSSSNGPSGSKDAATEDSGLPVFTGDGSVVVPPTDGSAPVDAGEDAAPVVGIDAGPASSFVSGLGPSMVAHSAHFTLITKTGGEPGGAGVKTSPHFTAISGVAPASSQ
jgi:hypothetical protein